MKVNNMNDDVFQDSIHFHDLRDLLSQPDYSKLRPCVGCEKPCPCSASPSSASPSCTCRPDWVRPPLAMSAACLWPADGSGVNWSI